MAMQAGPATQVPHKKQTFDDTFCGADCRTYKWSQTISDLDVVVPVPPGITSASDIEIDGTSDGICVRIKAPEDGGGSRIVMEGNFSFKTKPSEMMWSLEKGRNLNIHIEKAKERWWEALLEDEPKINLEELELSRPVSDLTEEEEMTLQKIWSKQLEKKNGPERTPQP